MADTHHCGYSPRGLLLCVCIFFSCAFTSISAFDTLVLSPEHLLYVWGRDGVVYYNRSIYDQVPPDLTERISIGRILRPTNTWTTPCNQPNCLEHVVIRLDEEPTMIAKFIVDELQKFEVNVTLTMPQLIDMVADAQLHQYLIIFNQLQYFLESKGFDNWEGGTTAFLPKMRMMRELVLRPHVKTVCEIGFNNGASTLMWLVSGANKVLSFDIGSHGYTTHAVDWLSQRFPGRFQVILGDSQYTVPSFHQMFSDEKCDLIFIDGGHTYDIALKDLVNFRALAREEKHILLMDDVLYDVARAWDIAIEKGLVVEEVREYSDVWSDGYSQPFSSHLDYNGGRLRNDPLVSHAEFPSAMSYGSYTSRKRN